MAQPNITPTWATDPTAQIAQPLASKASVGWVAGEKPFAVHQNWLFNIICQWIGYLKALTNEALTWNARQSFNGGATCPTPLNGNDVANKQYVDSHSGGGGSAGLSTYNTNDPAWLYSSMNPLVFWTEDKGVAFKPDGSTFEVKMVRFLGEAVPTTNDVTQFIGIMPPGSRPSKAVVINAMQYPNCVPVTVQPSGYMYLDSRAPVPNLPLVFDGCGYIAYQ